MLKGHERLRDKDFKNVEISYANDPITEYIGSHIYEIFNIPVHSTLLGAYRGKNCVLCSDNAYPRTLYEFRQFRNAIFADISQPTSGMSTYISDIIQVIELSNRIPKSAAYDRFWKMCVIDPLVRNTNRYIENGEFKLGGKSMQKKLLLIACLLSIAITGCGTQKMNNEETSHEDSAIRDMPWMELVQTYSKYNYDFEEWRDTETGVHYIVYKYRGTTHGDGFGIGGICPRYMNGTSVYMDAPESSVSENSQSAGE